MHGRATPVPVSHDPKSDRIARLSAEYLEADPARKDQIGDEIAALIEDRVLPFPLRD